MLGSTPVSFPRQRKEEKNNNKHFYTLSFLEFRETGLFELGFFAK
jgi:hypothetical protein